METASVLQGGVLGPISSFDVNVESAISSDNAEVWEADLKWKLDETRMYLFKNVPVETYYNSMILNF